MHLSLPGAEISVADGGEEHLDADLQRPRRRHLHLLHRQRHSGTPRHRRCMSNKQTKTQLYACFNLFIAAPPSIDATDGSTTRKSGKKEREAAGNTAPLHLMGFPRVPPATPPFPFVMASSSLSWFSPWSLFLFPLFLSGIRNRLLGSSEVASRHQCPAIYAPINRQPWRRRWSFFFLPCCSIIFAVWSKQQWAL